MLNISNLAYFKDTIQTQWRKKTWAQNLKDDIHICYQARNAIPMLFFSIKLSKLIYKFANTIIL